MTHRSGGNTRHVEPDSTSRVGEGRRAVGAVGTVCGDHCDDYDRGIGVRSWISEKRQGVTGDGKLIGYELKMGQSSSARLYTLSGPSHHVVLEGPTEARILHPDPLARRGLYMAHPYDTGRSEAGAICLGHDSIRVGHRLAA